MSDKQILYTSYEAAKFVTNIEGWVDSNHRFWGKDEHMARWSGCTHIICPGCGKPTQKNYTICSDCREKKAIERYEAKDRLKWDRQTPLYSEAADEYFFDEDQLMDYLADQTFPPGQEHVADERSLRLVICEPVYLREIEDDLFDGELPEDGYLPLDIQTALDNLNILIREQGPVSWSPGKYAAEWGGRE